MFSDAWTERRATDSAQRILQQIPSRAIDRGLAFRVADAPSVLLLALWSVLLWERKIGLVALEQVGGDRFHLIRGLDRLLDERALELPFAYEIQDAKVRDDQHVAIALPKSDRPVVGWDSVELLEPLLDEAQHQAKELGHQYVGSEHLVLAIAKLADPRLSALLRDCGVTHEKVREAVIELLKPEA